MSLVSFSELVTGAKEGKVVSFPTDTVPALAVRPDCAEAIFELKQREATKPLILMGASPEQLWDYVEGTPEEFQVWEQTAQQYFPGQLTLVLPSSSLVRPEVNPKTADTIGIRVPDCAIARQVFASTGVLATTSANRSGQPPLTTPEAINQAFPEVLVLADTEPIVSSGLPSTVAKWTGQDWEILRQGNIYLK
ncbi:SUA5/yciO/yrdC domain protein [Halothece sp. PCC 7418]|uniref:L-threonylcarbamoyladenylate synthase n=1 Tax=Halothece sp. (strain PCC 7418) TaxID=65093 RepID=UPI0002A061F9|nr:L-threonylcarbamoyladenylate synthase [Halothece sp. PCC 7418]AFZ42383.1 SUA5/yciO/yrdC domain protein [Halothece sp. PCC 7418]